MTKQEDDAFLVEVGDRLRSVRRSRRETQRDCADRCGLDRTYLSLVEHGKKNITLLSLRRIAGGYGVPLSYLLSLIEYEELS